jgi:hypothetical protein
MQSSGTTYEHSGNTTEWDDILIKKGIITREDALIAKGLNPEDVRLHFMGTQNLSTVTLFFDTVHQEGRDRPRDSD